MTASRLSVKEGKYLSLQRSGMGEVMGKDQCRRESSSVAVAVGVEDVLVQEI